MFPDFSKVNETITDVITVSDPSTDDYDKYDYVELYTKNSKIILKAIGESYSYSTIEKFENFNFNSLCGKNIKSIVEVDSYDYEYPFKLTQEHIKNDVSGATPHIYQIEFTNNVKPFQFLLVNFSDGWYDGWLEVNIEPLRSFGLKKE